MLTKEELPACPVATTVQLIGSKWKLLILRNLMARPWRFNELRRDLEGHQPEGPQASGCTPYSFMEPYPQQSHNDGPPCKQGKPKSFFASQFFSKDKIGENHCHQNTELIHRSHDTGRSFLEGSPVAQPGGSCGHAGQADKGQALFPGSFGSRFPFPGFLP